MTHRAVGAASAFTGGGGLRAADDLLVYLVRAVPTNAHHNLRSRPNVLPSDIETEFPP